MVLGGSNSDGVVIRIRGDNSDFIAALNQAKIAAASAVASIKATLNTGTIGSAMTASMTNASASLNNVSASIRNVSGSLGSVGSSFTTLGLIVS